MGCTYAQFGGSFPDTFSIHVGKWAKFWLLVPTEVTAPERGKPELQMLLRYQLFLVALHYIPS